MELLEDCERPPARAKPKSPRPHKPQSLDAKLKLLSFEGLEKVTDKAAVFLVRGSTGNLYRVSINDDGCKCQCVDHRIRKRDCKHIVLVLKTAFSGGQGQAHWRQAADALAPGGQVKLESENNSADGPSMAFRFL